VFTARYVLHSTFCPHSVFMCFVWISEQTAIISLYSIDWLVFIIRYGKTYLLTAIGLTAGGSSTVHIYIQIKHGTTQLTNWEGCGLCPVFASYILPFALQLRKKHGKSSVRVVGESHLAR
jgi:hypothetical protein